MTNAQNSFAKRTRCKIMAVEKKFGDVTFINDSETIKAQMEGASVAALKEVAKFLRKAVKAKIKDSFGKKVKTTGDLSRGVTSWVKKPRKGQDRAVVLEIGFMSDAKAKRKGLNSMFYETFHEFGTHARNNLPELAILRGTVEENVEQIRIIEGNYLKHIEDENRALGYLDEEDEEADEN